MNTVRSIKQVTFFAVFTFTLSVCSISEALSQAEVWTALETVEFHKRADKTAFSIGEVAYFSLDTNSLDELLYQLESINELKRSEVLIELPLPNGKVEVFKVIKDDLFPESSEKAFPEIRTYKGYSQEGSSKYLRFTKTISGYDFTIYSVENGIVRIVSKNGKTFESLYKKDVPYPDELAQFTCSAGEPYSNKGDIKEHGISSKRSLDDNLLRTYRIAIAATGEYTQNNGGSIAGALSAIVASLSNVTGYFEWEHSVSFTLISNNNEIVYTNSSTDPYDASDLSQMIEANRVNLDNVIGASNYDIGHVLSTNNLGGLAYVGVACVDGYKGGAVSSFPIPSGKIFDIDILGHELGHQFGATHTFNNSCGGSRVPTTAYEPGSGTTTLSYAGICAPNVESEPDIYFHGVNINQVSHFVSTSYGSNCPIVQDLGNHRPTISAGQDFVIPFNTPFALSATANDQDSDFLTYCWEQIDCVNQTTYDPVLDDLLGPLFRSWVPDTNPTRYFPKSEFVHSNYNYEWEELPYQSRELNFVVTARDNRSGNGLTAQDLMTVTVDGNSGPFVMLYPNEEEFWVGNEEQTIEWDVAATTNAPVSCNEVDIWLSIDGGNNYDILLVDNTPNDGEHLILVPNVETSEARVKVVCSNNIFYDVSNNNFSIEKVCTDLAPTLTVVPSVLTGISDVYIVVKVNEISTSDSEGEIRVTIPFDPRLTFSYNNSLTSLGFSTLDNIDWTYVGHNNLIHTFITTTPITTLGSSFGFLANFDPQNANGVTSITCTLRPFDGGECTVTNNSDSESLNFFSGN